jgi:hypothetical protein
MLKDAEGFITTDEACKLSGYSEQHLRKILREQMKKDETDRDFIARKFGRSWMVDRVSFLKFVEGERSKQLNDRRRGPKSQNS